MSEKMSELVDITEIINFIIRIDVENIKDVPRREGLQLIAAHNFTEDLV